jgi:spermidine synthase
MRMGVMRHLTLFVLVAASLSGASTPLERLVYETDSLYHHIIVSETEDLRILRFHRGPAQEALGSSFAQSVISLGDPNAVYMNYAKCALAATALKPQPRRALFVGLGAGSMPRAFAAAFPDCTVEVAEIDEKVVDVARRYFFLGELPNMKITVADGRVHIRRSQEKYDIVVLDAYRDEMIPFHLMTRDFLEELKGKLADGAVVVSNIAVKDGAQLYPWLLRTYQVSFGTILETRVPRSINKILVCLVPEKAAGREELATKARELGAGISFGFDLGAYAQGYRDVSSSVAAERVLTDDYAPVNLMWRRKADEKDWEY